MILDCTYITNSDAGLFESTAKLNTASGEVFDIEMCTDDEQENIETVYSEDVYFKLGNKEYTFAVCFDDSAYTLKNPADLKTIQGAALASQQ